MSKWIESLANWQKIILATIFGLLGITLWVLPFYLTGKEMISPTGIETEWTQQHWIFILFGTIALAISLKLSRLDKLFNMSTGFLSKFLSKKKEDNDES